MICDLHSGGWLVGLLAPIGIPKRARKFFFPTGDGRFHFCAQACPLWERLPRLMPKSEREPLIETLGATPHWQNAVVRARALARTDPRAAAWVEAFVEGARPIVLSAFPDTAKAPQPGRFEIGRAGVAMPPELTDILRQALGNEGPTLRAVVFLLVGAAVRAPLMPAGTARPWDTYEKLRMIGRALPESRRLRWREALPAATHPLAGPAVLAGRRLVAQAFNGLGRPAPAPPSLEASAAIDLLLSALIFRACAELADAHPVERTPSAAA